MLPRLFMSDSNGIHHHNNILSSKHLFPEMRIFIFKKKRKPHSNVAVATLKHANSYHRLLTVHPAVASRHLRTQNQCRAAVKRLRFCASLSPCSPAVLLFRTCRGTSFSSTWHRRQWPLERPPQCHLTVGLETWREAVSHPLRELVRKRTTVQRIRKSRRDRQHDTEHKWGFTAFLASLGPRLFAKDLGTLRIGGHLNNAVG